MDWCCEMNGIGCDCGWFEGVYHEDPLDTYKDHTPLNFVETCLYEEPFVFGLQYPEKHMVDCPF